MAELAACPSCQRQLQVPENFLGQTVQCPECQHTFEAVAVSDAVQTVAPIPKPTSSKHDLDPADEQPRRRRRFEDDDDYDDDLPRRRPRYLTPHRGTLILTLGIMSIFIAPLILGTIAWIMGNADLRAIESGEMDPEGKSQTYAGRTIGMVMVCLSVVSFILVGVFIAVMIVTGTMR